MSKKTISYNDNAAETAGKLNDNFNELYSGQGGILARNAESVQRIYAAKKHLDMTHSGWTDSVEHSEPKPLFCIAHGSDFHLDNTRYGNFRDFVDSVSAIDVALNTGDMCYYGGANEMAYQQQVQFQRLQPLLCIGNHDRWGGQTDEALISGLGMTDGLYYKKDYTDSLGNKIRIIVLNRYDKSGLDHPLDGLFSSTQIDWFVGQLDNAITNNYNVIVAMHAVDAQVRPATNDKGFWQRHYQWQNMADWSESAPIIEDIIAAFRNGGTVNDTYTFRNTIPSITLNHTFSGSGKFVCYIVGHAHIDTIGFSSNTGHSDQLYLTVPAGCCYPTYTGWGSVQSPFYIGGEVSDLPRIAGTKSEDCFNVYGFDFVNKLVKVVRVGADMNDLMEPREVACFEYEPTNS